MTLRTLPSIKPGATDSGHPDPERPYFAEYAPLISSNRPGVNGYRLEFAYERFFAEGDDRLPELQHYLDSLIALARLERKSPAFKFCRSLGRAAWMRKTFPDALHVLVVRHPWGQWTSAWNMFVRDGNPYFIALPLRILVQFRAHPTVDAIASSMKLRLEDYALPERHAATCKAIRNIPLPTLYRLFLTFWAVTSVAAAPEADAIVESDRLVSPAYRSEVENFFYSNGMAIDLSGARGLWRNNFSAESFDAERALADAIAAANLARVAA